MPTIQEIKRLNRSHRLRYIADKSYMDDMWMYREYGYDNDDHVVRGYIRIRDKRLRQWLYRYQGG